MFMLRSTHKRIVKELTENLTKQIHEAGDARNRNQRRADYIEAKLAELLDGLKKMPRSAREV